MKQIVCLSHEPWSGTPGRTQHLMTRLKDAQVLWFQNAEGPFDRSFRGPGRKVRPHVTVYTLPPERPALLQKQNAPPGSVRRQGAFIAEKMARHRFRDAAVWCTDPRQVHLLEHLDYARLIYDCHQDWSELPIQWESDLTLQSDVVFAASDALAEYLSPCSHNVALLPNGVNYSLFAQDYPPVAVPSFCYVGTLYPDLDLSPLLYAAREKPDWRFTLAGGVAGNGPRGLNLLQRQPNVRLLSRVEPVDVPDLLARARVCLNFLRDTDADHGILPVRMYEYLATGKPIVSMLWPDQVEKFADVVYGAHDERDFVRTCERALEESPGWVSGRRREYAAAAAWQERVNEVRRILDALST